MFNPNRIILELENNGNIFKEFFHSISNELVLFKPSPDKWSMLEIVCHLKDEEVEDWRTRIKCQLETPGSVPPPIDPVSWVKDRKYIEQDFGKTTGAFLNARQESIAWLQSLDNPQWDNFYMHQNLGPLSAKFFLCNWLAHDYLHLRQMTWTKFEYHRQKSEVDLSYAGNW
jgi:hypothetical protein